VPYLTRSHRRLQPANQEARHFDVYTTRQTIESDPLVSASLPSFLLLALEQRLRRGGEPVMKKGRQIRNEPHDEGLSYGCIP
jgi:hypothetical protein